MNEQRSYLTILRSSSIIAGAQVINILSGLLKMKAAAMLLGPTGIGLIGLYMNLIQTAATVSALGLSNVGTRQIAAAHAEGGDVRVGRTRRSLFWMTIVLAICGAGLFWSISDWIAHVLLKDPPRASDLAWLSIGVALTVAAGSQSALLTGLRRVRDLAWVTIGSGASAALFGMVALWLWGTSGIVVMVIAAPAASFLLGHVFVARLGPPRGPQATMPEMAGEWHVMAKLGIAFMLSGLITLLGQLTVRALVQRELGTEALGQFQAAWTIGMTYLGFVLGAMGTDYYPRLSAAIGDPAAASRLVNEQTEVALLLCAPVLLAVLGLAPWVIGLLYSTEFGPAIQILRWQLLGDILKVMSWPLGFLLLARGAGKTFVLTEALGMGAFVLGVFFGLPIIGVVATGASFLILYVVYLPLVWWFGRRMIGFHWNKAIVHHGLALMFAATFVVALATYSDILSGLLGIGLAITFGLHSLVRISRQITLPGHLGRIAALVGNQIRNKGASNG